MHSMIRCVTFLNIVYTEIFALICLLLQLTSLKTTSYLFWLQLKQGKLETKQNLL